MKPSIVIDCFSKNGLRYRTGYAVVAIDVIRATTVAITAVASGWRCFPVASLEEATEIASFFTNSLLMGELSGDMPDSFEMNNSPAELVTRTDLHRPIVLLSSNGTKLIATARSSDATYLACLRNFRGVAHQLAGKHERIAIIGAGSRGEFREEDQMCCAWIGELLAQQGYRPENAATEEIIAKWSGAPASAFIPSKSVDYLRRTDQLNDLDYILEHVDDLRSTYVMEGGEVIAMHQPQTIIINRPITDPAVPVKAA
ncbi:MAG TPA: 2-phosphosulfolactate phosphatase [Terriglobales bacterium]|nr:2-phosphosulfolactate phosphatase [Terriglobales bacterium]